MKTYRNPDAAANDAMNAAIEATLTSKGLKKGTQEWGREFAAEFHRMSSEAKPTTLAAAASRPTPTKPPAPVAKPKPATKPFSSTATVETVLETLRTLYATAPEGRGAVSKSLAAVLTRTPLREPAARLAASGGADRDLDELTIALAVGMGGESSSTLHDVLDAVGVTMYEPKIRRRVQQTAWRAGLFAASRTPRRRRSSDSPEAA